VIAAGVPVLEVLISELYRAFMVELFRGDDTKQ
jgi:hypothetical protein